MLRKTSSNSFSEEIISEEEQGYFSYLSSCLIYAVQFKDAQTIYSTLNEARTKNIGGKVNLAYYLLNKTDEQGKTLLHIAASIEENANVINELCQAAKKSGFAQFSSRLDKTGATAGHYSIESGSFNNFRVLLDDGLNTNIQKFSTAETVKDMINTKYADDEHTYLIFMNAFVLSNKGKEYFSFRHNGIKPDALTEETLTESLRIDKIADCNNEPALHFKALHDCFEQLEKKDINRDEINLFISHMNAVEGPEKTLHPAINITLLFDKQNYFSIKSPLMILVFLSIQPPPLTSSDFFSEEKEKTIEKERMHFIEASFLSKIAQYSENKEIKRVATRAAFGKYLRMESPILVLSGLKQLHHPYIYKHQKVENQASKCFYVTALVNNFLKIALKKNQSEMSQTLKKQRNPSPPSSYFFKNSDETVETYILSLYILESIILLFENLIEINEIPTIIKQIDSMLKGENISPASIKKTISFDYINRGSSEPLEAEEFQKIMQNIFLSSTEHYKKLDFSFVAQVKKDLIQLLHESKIIQSPQETSKLLSFFSKTNFSKKIPPRVEMAKGAYTKKK
jgi:hypothetical protein